MRQVLGTSLVFALLIGSLAACGDDPSPVFANIKWKVRCDQVGGCSGIPARDIEHLDGEEDHNITCSVTSTAGGNQRLSFSANMANEYGIAIQGAEFSSAGVIVGAGCQATVREEGNNYTGTCGSSTIVADCLDDNEDPPGTVVYTECFQPCRLHEIQVADESSGPVITAKLECRGLGNRADRLREREVTGPTSSTTPVSIEIQNCSGL